MADELFAINISGDEADGDDGTETKDKWMSREEKNYQSEEVFQQLRAEYRPKIENGEIWQTIKLPLGPTVSKMAAQELLHAVEELYCYRRYAEAAGFATRVLDEPGGLDADTKTSLISYRRKCRRKAGLSD